MKRLDSGALQRHKCDWSDRPRTSSRAEVLQARMQPDVSAAVLLLAAVRCREGCTWLVQRVLRRQPHLMRAERQPQCGSRQVFVQIQQPHLLKFRLFWRNLGTTAEFGQSFFIMRLLAGYSGNVIPPIGGWLIILSRCTGQLCHAGACNCRNMKAHGMPCVKMPGQLNYERCCELRVAADMTKS